MCHDIKIVRLHCIKCLGVGTAGGSAVAVTKVGALTRSQEGWQLNAVRSRAVCAVRVLKSEIDPIRDLGAGITSRICGKF